MKLFYLNKFIKKLFFLNLSIAFLLEVNFVNGQVCETDVQCFVSKYNPVLVTFNMGDNAQDTITLIGQDQDPDGFTIEFTDDGSSWVTLGDDETNSATLWHNIEKNTSAGSNTLELIIRHNSSGSGGLPHPVYEEECMLRIGGSGLDASKFLDGRIDNGSGNQFIAVIPDTPTPLDLVFCLDGSGSMNQASKWEKLSDAAKFMTELFTATTKPTDDLIAHQIGAVIFRCDCPGPLSIPECEGPFEDELGLSFLHISAQPAFEQLETTLESAPANCTPVWDGVLRSRELFGSSDHQKRILLISDGKHNTGSDRPAASIFTGDGIITYTIGIGKDEEVEPQQIRDWALDTYGDYRITDDELVLRAFFVEVLGSVLGLERIPVSSTDDFPVGIDAKKIVLALNWTGASTNFYDFRIEFNPDAGTNGTDISTFSWDRTTNDFNIDPLIPGINCYYSEPGSGDKNVYWIVEREAGTSENLLAGQWSFIDIDEQGSDSASPEGLEKLVFVNPDIQSQFWFERNSHGTGQAIQLFADLRDSTIPIAGADVIVEVTKPVEAVGELLSTVPPPKFIPDQKNDALSPRLVHLGSVYQYLKRNKLRTASETIKLYDDGTHGDQIKNDGKYTNSYSSTEYEGSFTFRYIAQGTTPSNKRFARTRTIAERVHVNVTPANTKMSSKPVACFDTKLQRAEVLVVPKDQFGRRLGPYRTQDLAFQAKNAILVGSVMDNRDGTYSQLIEYTSDKKVPAPIVTAFVRNNPVGRIRVKPPERSYSHFDGSLFAGRMLFDSDLLLDDGLIVGIQSNVKILGRLRVEAEALIGQTQSHNGEFGEYIALSGGFRFKVLKIARLESFIKSRATYWDFRDLNVSVKNYGAMLGYEILYPISKRVSTRAEIRDYILFDAKDNGELYHNLAILFSLSIIP